MASIVIIGCEFLAVGLYVAWWYFVCVNSDMGASPLPDHEQLLL